MQDNGASSDEDRAVVNGAEGVGNTDTPVSALRASVPSARWAILDSYGYEAVEVVRETAACVFYKLWNREHTDWLERRSMNVLPWRGDEDAANRLREQLRSARAELSRRQSEATLRFRRHVAELTEATVSTAQGIEAGTATTGTGVVHESPVPEGNAP